MNVLIINGRPRKTGSNATIANVFGEAASAKGANVRCISYWCLKV
jgi:multimeric flavodoxin WrbA